MSCIQACVVVLEPETLRCVSRRLASRVFTALGYINSGRIIAYFLTLEKALMLPGATKPIREDICVCSAFGSRSAGGGNLYTGPAFARWRGAGEPLSRKRNARPPESPRRPP
ncbi:hypothetical protein EYF80_033550 [Liparis tanakae]|uniref:Uncharacterized protein n=1 Tax=Liparis tanakae TaxID=230148 RepID=A0A4Z2GRQ8_9TELE|nr:hypothetical protein EYF80_033550 [Liparis tanakae]